MTIDLTTHDSLVIRDMRVMMSVGILDEEKIHLQPILINATIYVPRNIDMHSDDIGDVLSYADIVADIETITADGHTHLLETLAEKIMEKILSYPRAKAARLSIEKTVIFKNIDGIGVEIYREK